MLLDDVLREPGSEMTIQQGTKMIHHKSMDDEVQRGLGKEQDGHKENY